MVYYKHREDHKRSGSKIVTIHIIRLRLGLQSRLRQFIIRKRGVGVSLQLLSERQACPLDKISEISSEQNLFVDMLVAVL